MNSSPFKNEGWLYGLAFLIALGFRFIQLGAAPLTDSEATLALQALQLAQGKAPLLGPQPGYILLTSILFVITEGTNFMARFLPAAAGSVLVFVPWFFREKIKPRPALVLAFLFAFDPGLVALSRQVNGTMLAATFLLLAWAMWLQRRALPAGIFAGLALLSGPSLWAGLLVLALTGMFLRGAQPRPTESDEARAADGSATPESESIPPQAAAIEYRPAILALIATLLLGGTLFFLSPNGLSAWLSSLPAYFKGWTSASPMTPGRMLLVFLTYEPLGILLAVLALVRGYLTGSRRVLRLSLWLAVALLLAVFYRQTSELVWVIIPLLALAAFELSRLLTIFPEERMEVGVVVMALMILFAYIWFDISKIAVNPQAALETTTLPLFNWNIQIASAPYVVLLGAGLIIILCVSFVAFGWSVRTAWLGATWSFVIFLGLYMVAAAWGASGLRSENGVELWTPDQPPLQADLLLTSVNDVSEFSTGDDRSQPVTVTGIDSPALEWLLRNRTVEVVSILDSEVAPPIVITPLLENPDLVAAYRGQDFTWRQAPQWELVKSPDWFRWLVFRQLPRENETIILWVRNDLFPDGRGTSQ